MTDKIDERMEGASDAELDPRAQGEAMSAADAPAGDDIQSLRERLQAAEAEASSNHDKYLRALADLENNKKRMERAYADRTAWVKKDILSKLLAVKDNLERALNYGGSTDGNGEGIMEGIRLTQFQLDRVLSQEGVEPMDTTGKPFDPRTEEAVHSVEDPSVPDHTVVQEVRKGYTLNGEVLRPAQVVVSVHGQE